MKSIYFHRDLKHFNSLSAINTHYRVNFIRFWKVVKFVLLNILKYKFHIKNYLKEEIKKKWRNNFECRYTCYAYLNEMQYSLYNTIAHELEKLHKIQYTRVSTFQNRVFIS